MVENLATISLYSKNSHFGYSSKKTLKIFIIKIVARHIYTHFQYTQNHSLWNTEIHLYIQDTRLPHPSNPYLIYDSIIVIFRICAYTLLYYKHRDEHRKPQIWPEIKHHPHPDIASKCNFFNFIIKVIDILSKFISFQ